MTESNHPVPTKILTWQEKLQTAKQFKGEGNGFYKENKYKAAMGKYHRALLYLKGIEGAAQSMTLGMLRTPEVEAASLVTEEGKAEVDQLKIACFNNLAACLLQCGDDDEKSQKVVSYCDDVLQLAPTNIKALFRKGQALFKLKDYDRAQEVLRKASNLPDGAKDTKVKNLLQLCNQCVAEEDKKLRMTYKSMFSQLSLDDLVSTPTGSDSSESPPASAK